jgi:hypothetical protein
VVRRASSALDSHALSSRKWAKSAKCPPGAGAKAVSSRGFIRSKVREFGSTSTLRRSVSESNACASPSIELDGSLRASRFLTAPRIDVLPGYPDHSRASKGESFRDSPLSGSSAHAQHGFAGGPQALKVRVFGRCETAPSGPRSDSCVPKVRLFGSPLFLRRWRCKPQQQRGKTTAYQAQFARRAAAKSTRIIAARVQR